MNKAEAYFLERGRYGEIARKVDRCLAIADRFHAKPCLGGECDQEHSCERHANTSVLIDRYLRRYGGK